MVVLYRRFFQPHDRCSEHTYVKEYWIRSGFAVEYTEYNDDKHWALCRPDTFYNQYPSHAKIEYLLKLNTGWPRISQDLMVVEDWVEKFGHEFCWWRRAQFDTQFYPYPDFSEDRNNSRKEEFRSVKRGEGWPIVLLPWSGDKHENTISAS